MKRLGSNRYPPPTSCKVAALVDPQLHASWLSLMTLNLCLGVACHVSRPRYVSYHSQRPLCTSSGRSIHGVKRTTSSGAPAQLVGQIAALHPLAAVRSAQNGPEGVAPLLRHDVHHGTIGIDLGRDAA